MQEYSLFEAFAKIQNIDDFENFLKDLCTPQEVQLLKERWGVCQLLYTQKYSYREIQNKTGASLTTITRVARFLKDEKNFGYIKIIELLNNKEA